MTLFRLRFTFLFLTLFASTAFSAEIPNCKTELKDKLKEVCLQALNNDPQAQYQMARLYGDQTISKLINYEESFYWHKRLSRLADEKKLMDDVYTSTMYNTGVFYTDGVGTQKNPENALFWFKKTALRGNAKAMLRIAIIYSNGLGVAADQKVSLEWLNKAVDAGSLEAKVLLAQGYLEGSFVQKNPDKAIQLLQEAAKNNSPRGNFALANLYLHGIGVTANTSTAKHFFSTACRLQVLEACKNYHDIDTQAALTTATP